MTRLSHEATVLFKFVWPCGWLGLIGSFLFGALFGAPPRWGPGISHFWGTVILIVLFAFGVFFTVTVSLPLKRVDRDGALLRISNYMWEDVAPIADIRKVKIRGEFERHNNSMPSVTVWFRERRKIVFLARTQEVLDSFLASLPSGTTGS